VQNLNSKGLMDTYSGGTVSARTERNVGETCENETMASNAVEAIWNIFWKEHDFYAKGLQWLKLWEMIVRRLKF